MASGDEKANKFWVNVKKDIEQLYEKVKQYPLISLLFIAAVLLLIFAPHVQVSLSGINNSTIEAAQENQDRATIAQILGGVAIGIGLYYTWRRIGIAEEDLKATKEGQITERFTRAVDQLGNRAMEIRLGGIYALERIANESEKDYWPIMEILTAYVRKNSSVDVIENKKVPLLAIDIQANESKQNEVSEMKKIALDIQAVLTVLGRRINSFNNGEANRLNLRVTCLHEANLIDAHLEGADLSGAHLEGADFYGAHLENAILSSAHLENANLIDAHLEGAKLIRAHLEGAKLIRAHLGSAILSLAHLEKANLIGAHLENAYLIDAHLEGADLIDAHLEGANLGAAHLENANLTRAHLESAFIWFAHLEEVYFRDANLKGAKKLTSDQLSKVKTLYKAELDEGLEVELRAKDFGYLLDDEPKY